MEARVKKLSWQQQAALNCLQRNYGETDEATLALEGLGYVRVTMKSLERMGFVTRGDFEPTTGYSWLLEEGAGIEPARPEDHHRFRDG